MVANVELELTSATYCTALLVELVERFQASVMPHVELEQEVSGS